MAALKNLVADFKQYLDGLEKQDLVALLKDLIDDADGLSPKQMYNILKRAGVEGYSDRLTTATKYYSKEEAVAMSKKMGGKGRVEQQCLAGGLPYWVDLDTGELWSVELARG